MKSKYAILLAIALTVGMLAACQTSVISQPSEKGEITLENGTAAEETIYGTPSFEVVADVGTLPGHIASGIDKLSKTRGFSFFRMDDYLIVSVNSGERNTGGYGIKVKSVEEVDGITQITVEESSPEKDAIVTKALTYPMTVIRIKSSAGDLKVADVNGGQFSSLNIEVFMNISADGVYSGQIDNNSIEIYVDGKPEAFRTNQSFDQALSLLNEDDTVSLSYYINEYGQQILTKLEREEN